MRLVNGKKKGKYNSGKVFFPEKMSLICVHEERVSIILVQLGDVLMTFLAAMTKYLTKELEEQFVWANK